MSVKGPPFTVPRYGSLAETIIAQRDWLQGEVERLRAALERIVGCYDGERREALTYAPLGIAREALGSQPAVTDEHKPGT